MLICAAIGALLFGAAIDEGVRRVETHLFIGDSLSALAEAEDLIERYPRSSAVGGAMIEALAANGYEERALDLLEYYGSVDPKILTNRELLESLSWGILHKGVDSNQYGVRLASLIGAFFTRDSRAVPVLLHAMRDSNAVVRSVSVQLAASYGDAPLKDEITRLLKEEKIWMVRLEVIKAIGSLHMYSLVPQLQAIAQDEKSTYEERTLAIEALVTMHDALSLDELTNLAKSPRAGLRHLACSLAAHFTIPNSTPILSELVKDTHPDVRIAAINAIGLTDPKGLSTKELRSAMEDPYPAVAITASWLALITEPKLGEPALVRWLEDTLTDNRRLAAAAIAAAGDRGVGLAVEGLERSQDPYVRANLALGLIGQRQEVTQASDVLYQFLESDRNMWMWDQRTNPLFHTLAPSQVRYNDQIPNYPEAIDQMTRLNLVSLLAVVDDPRAITALKKFLQRKSWGLTGVAAATLLQEGDDTALELVRGLMNDDEFLVRLQACLVLALFGKDDTVLPQLQKAYVDASHEYKLHILEACGHIGQEENQSFLIGVFREPFPMLRIAAAAALIQGLN